MLNFGGVSAHKKWLNSQPPLQPKWEEGKCSSIGPLADDNIWGFPKMVVPNNFPTKNDHFRVFWGYHHFWKHPYIPKNPGRIFSPSKIEWDRIPTDQNNKFLELVDTQVFFGVHSVGPTVGDFLDIHDMSPTCASYVTNSWIILLMAEILHQLIGMFIPLFTGFYTSQVVQDFFHQQ